MIVNINEANEIINKKNLLPSSITDPVNGSVFYVAKKVASLASKLQSVNNCLIFAEEEVEFIKEIVENNMICIVQSAPAAYGRYTEFMRNKDLKNRRNLKYKLTKDGVYIGEDVSIGINTTVKQGTFLDHGVTIGDNCTISRNVHIYSGSVIGSNCNIYENVVIGNEPFNYYEDQKKMIRMFPLGGVKIHDNVDIGVSSIIDKGSISNTSIGNNTKIDVFVHIGHDAEVYENVIITAQSSIGAFSIIEQGVKVYTSKIMKRTKVGKKAILGFSSSVFRNVKEGCTMIGNPARRM